MGPTEACYDSEAVVTVAILVVALKVDEFLSVYREMWRTKLVPVKAMS